MKRKASLSLKSTIVKKIHRSLSEKLLKPEKAGFSMIELMITVSMIGALAAIAAPGWSALINNQRLRASNNRAYQIIKTAQTKAIQHKTTWQASFQQEQGKTIKWAVHQATVEPEKANWENLNSFIQVDDETTLYKYPSSKYPSSNIWRVQFNHKGHVNGRLGRLTLSLQSGGKAKRCVLVSTLLGKMRISKDQPKPKDEKYCY
ncbi:MAG: prepilin-type N-terminal cleavage/methylation domain-containing protein [Trichodesmium sp. St18_bin3_1_1]|nr:prepilin-type N-terminal cleavage/methylation domain-containing protein [Trichodesmium sp. St18_bin3_1_1]